MTNVNAATLGGLNGANFWKTTGNTGTAAGVNFLGTADNQPPEIKINGSRVLRFEPNVIGGAAGNFVASDAQGATIAGGGSLGQYGGIYTNAVAANYSTIGARERDRARKAGKKVDRAIGGRNGNGFSQRS